MVENSSRSNIAKLSFAFLVFAIRVAFPWITNGTNCHTALNVGYWGNHSSSEGDKVVANHVGATSYSKATTVGSISYYGGDSSFPQVIDPAIVALPNLSPSVGIHSLPSLYPRRRLIESDEIPSGETIKHVTCRQALLEILLPAARS